jgi:hypothetical protein
VAVYVGPLALHHFSEAIMKAILAMALVLGVCGLAGAADDKAVDPVGTWKCEYEIGGQKRTSTLTIKKDGDKLAGTMRRFFAEPAARQNVQSNAEWKWV